MDLQAMSIKELAERYAAEGSSCPEDVLASMQADRRAGVRALAAQVERRRQANRAEGQRLRKMLEFETRLWAEGYQAIAGTDEVGVGPLAGPVMSAAVILPRDFRARGLNDSKQLDHGERTRLAAEVRANAVAWALGEASVEEIDRLNIYQASLLSMRRAVKALAVKPDYLLIDARALPELRIPQEGLIKGDARSLSIAAASVVAKVTRDALMEEFEARYPGYGFGQHKGYPAPLHLERLRALGPCPIHRRSFAPVREALARGPAQGRWGRSDG